MEKNVNMIENLWGRVLFPAAAHNFVERKELLVCLQKNESQLLNRGLSP
jgi:hypothetical protein